MGLAAPLTLLVPKRTSLFGLLTVVAILISLILLVQVQQHIDGLAAARVAQGTTKLIEGFLQVGRDINQVWVALALCLPFFFYGIFLAASMRTAESLPNLYASELLGILSGYVLAPLILKISV